MSDAPAQSGDDSGQVPGANGSSSSHVPAPTNEELERVASRQRLLEYQEAMALRASLGPPVSESFMERRQDAQGNPPLFSFGVITDIQYADIKDGHSFLGIPRYYRHSLEVTKRAVASWNQAPNLRFAVHFGDLVDGYCPKDQSLNAFNRVMGELDQVKSKKVYHIIGNHCLYNLPREELNSVLQIPPAPDGASYYSFSPYAGFRVVVLDAYDISDLGWPENHPKALEAKRLLEKNNPNPDKNSPHGLTGPARRFVKYNGGLGEGQVLWLKNLLKECDLKREVVCVACHMPVDPSTLPTPTCLLWNYEEVLDILRASTCVVAFICGHAHFGAYSVDSAGIHYRVLEAVLESPPGTDAFGRMDVYQDRMCLVGSGRMLSTEFKFRNQLLLPASL